MGLLLMLFRIAFILVASVVCPCGGFWARSLDLGLVCDSSFILALSDLAVAVGNLRAVATWSSGLAVAATTVAGPLGDAFSVNLVKWS